MELKLLPISDIYPYENNPRRNDAAVEAVAESIRQCGYIAPIIIDENNVILAGHTRYKALKLLGKEQAEVIIKAGLSEEQKRKYRLLDNKTAEIAEWDFERLVAELDDLDFGELVLDWGLVCPDSFGEEFSLPEGDKSDWVQMTFQFSNEQADLVKWAMQQVKGCINQTFGNQNSNGNALYEVVRQWAELKT